MHWDQGRTWTGDGVELVGLTPFVVDNLYEFTLEDGSVVHLHDGDCTRVSYQPSEATITVDDGRKGSQ